MLSRYHEKASLFITFCKSIYDFIVIYAATFIKPSNSKIELTIAVLISNSINVDQLLIQVRYN